MKTFHSVFFISAALLIFSTAHAQHALQVDDGAGNISKIVAPSTPTIFKLPASIGTSGQALVSDGTGGFSYKTIDSFSHSFLYEYLDAPPGQNIGFFNGSPIFFNHTPINTGNAFTLGQDGIITINETGLYQVDFSVTLSEFKILGRFSLVQNQAIIPGTTCLATEPYETARGMAFISLQAGDILYLVTDDGSPIVTILGASLRMSRVQ